MLLTTRVKSDEHQSNRDVTCAEWLHGKRQQVGCKRRHTTQQLRAADEIHLCLPDVTSLTRQADNRASAHPKLTLNFLDPQVLCTLTDRTPIL
jgi:hypothetical protein